MSFFQYTSFFDRKDSYFAAANTKDGFISYFDDVFNSVPKIYVIKGGPGTGKSTLMNKIAAEGENRGYRVQKYYCSSDSSSLDGVIVGEEFAVIDATSPHATEPRYVGAVDEVINLCDMWKGDVLASQKNEICSLTKEISQKYKGVYRLLSAMATLEKEYLKIVDSHINKEKLQKFTNKIAISGSRSIGIQRKLCDAVGVFGRVHFSTLENGVKRTVYLGGKYHEGEIILKYLKKSLESRGCGYDFSVSPESLEVCSIRISEEIAFVCADPPADTRPLNTQRFLLPSIKNDKTKLKTIDRLCKDIGTLACTELEAIGILHNELENCYKKAMDYDKLDRFTKKLLIKMFC